ncbi:MAG TPA: haloacid dehalogenase type II [Acidocella sp.]|nr:haloacid dehalogenase type II [Acidocella sp.]
MTVNFSQLRAMVFDAYGTLFDVGSAVAACDDMAPPQRTALAALWRDKQLQYTWLRGLQKRHAGFDQVTAEALDYALEATGLANPERRQRLLALYQTLTSYPEVPQALAALKARGLATAILSNGTPDMLRAAVEHAGIGHLLDHVLSVEEVGVFKPAPEVYQLAVDRLGLRREEIGFVSANGWDAYAASAFGFQVVWCNRAGQPVERLPGVPRHVIHSLAELPLLMAA